MAFSSNHKSIHIYAIVNAAFSALFFPFWLKLARDDVEHNFHR